MSPFLEQLKIQYPIFLSPMAGISTPHLAAQISNAGGLGAIALGASSLSEASTMIEQAYQLTDSPFQANFFCHQTPQRNEKIEQNWLNFIKKYFSPYQITVPKKLNEIYQSFLANDDFLKLILDFQLPIVSFHFGLPHPHQIQALKAAKIITMASVTQLSEAQAAQKAGIDILIAQGIEAGGHRGCFNASDDSTLTTFALLDLLRQHIDLPLVAAGGIMDGHEISLALSHGAQAAQLGTAFIACSESGASEPYKKALFSHPQTQITQSISGRPARGLISYWQMEIDHSNHPSIPPYPLSYDIAKKLNALSARNADYHFHAFWAGQNVKKIRKLDAKALMDVLIQEMC